MAVWLQAEDEGGQSRDEDFRFQVTSSILKCLSHVGQHTEELSYEINSI